MKHCGYGGNDSKMLSEAIVSFCKRTSSEGEGVNDFFYRSAKACGLHSVRFVLPADHCARLRLLTLPVYPTCGSVVVYEAQRSFHTTQITNLTVPLSTAHHHWLLPTT